MTTKRVVISFLALLALGCTDATQIGANFIKSDHLSIFQVDTISWKASTVHLDSTYSDATTRFLVGNHEDPKLGTITAQPYFTFKTNTGSELENIAAYYKRTTLVLAYDRYSYYDTLEDASISVHRVREEIKPHAEDGHFYNTMSFRYDQEPLGSLTFRAYPKKRDTVEIALDDVFGMDLFNKAKEKSDTLKTDAAFSEFLKGFTLRSRSKTAPFLGFNTKVELRIYYRNNSLVPEQEKIFKFTVSEIKFNSIKSDRTNTDLSTLTERIYPLSSVDAKNTVYIQGGTPIGTRIEFPYLKRILLDNPDLILSEAYLELWPVNNSEGGNTGFPDNISMLLANSRNELQQPPNGWANSAALQKDHLYGKDFYYSTNIKAYINTELSQNETGSALILLPTNTDISASVNRLYLNTGKTDRTIKLKLYFITPKL